MSTEEHNNVVEMCGRCGTESGNTESVISDGNVPMG